jgi:hypothetical protein
VQVFLFFTEQQKSAFFIMCPIEVFPDETANSFQLKADALFLILCPVLLNN